MRSLCLLGQGENGSVRFKSGRKEVGLGPHLVQVSLLRKWILLRETTGIRGRTLTCCDRRCVSPLLIHQSFLTMCSCLRLSSLYSTCGGQRETSSGEREAMRYFKLLKVKPVRNMAIQPLMGSTARTSHIETTCPGEFNPAAFFSL